MRSKRVLSWLGAGLVSLSAASADAAPKLRAQVDQRGDFVLLGNTLAHDCASGIPTPLVGTVGNCGNSTSDSGADVYWRSDEPSAGQARANDTISNSNARSTAMLVLPVGATVTHAYLYWAAAVNSDTAHSIAVIERPGAAGFTQELTAIESFKAYATGTYPQRAYQSVANITGLVQQHGPGAYRVSGVVSAPLMNQNSETLFAGWWMAVFYSLPTDPPRNLALFDGLDPVSPSQPANATISGFLVPDAGFTGKLGVVAFEGDSAHSGDQFSFNDTAMSDALNPSNNFFNGTRSNLGVAVSNAGDLPQLRGTAGSMSGLDLDVVDVTSKLKAGDTFATIKASTSLDVFFLGGFVTSISTFRPDFTTSTKEAKDVNGGSLLPGDIIEYTIVVKNTGNDASVNTVLTDPLPTGVTYVPGSLRITAGANSGAKTDAAGDDQGNYNAATRTVTFRLGTGANATSGGKLAVNGSTTVSFQVKVDANATGTIANQATISAAGDQGAPVAHTPTDGNGPIDGSPATEVTVRQCDNDSHCGGSNSGMVCDANVCVPGCRKTGGNGCQGVSQCTSTGTEIGECVSCITDAHCGNSTSARVCDDVTRTCVNGCRGQAGNGCGGANVCTSTTKTIGQCVACTNDSHCGTATSGKVCASLTHTCIDGCRGQGGNGCAGDDVCTSSTTNIGQCVECNVDADCGGASSGLVCDTSTNTCGHGCRGTDGNTCPTDYVCTSNDQIIGQCVGCLSDSDCGDTSSGKVCDTGSRTCIDGCRDSGGNGCGANEVCTSTDTSVGECVGCLADGDCGDVTSGKVCNGDTRTCENGCRGESFGNGCSSANHCTSTDASIGQCVGCLTDSDCGELTSGTVCKESTNTCVAGCRGTDGNNCGAVDFCTSADSTIGQCVGCFLDVHCGGPDSGKVCDTGAHSCIDGCRGESFGNGCADDLACTSTDDVIGECVTCVVDTDCGDTTSGKVCDTSTNECTAGCRGTDGNGCSESDTCTSTDDTIGTCVGCLVDSDCGDVTSGSVCDDATQTCIAGCRGTNGNGCFGATVVCTSTDDTIGQCVGCVEDGDCGAQASGKVCDSDTQTCIDGCRGTDGNGCKGEALCTSTDDGIGSCVECLTDADCGDVESGKVCDTGVQKCIDGCRGTNGNGCSGSDICTSTDDTIGSCENPGAGGAGGEGGNAGAGGAGGNAGTGGDGDAGVGGDDFGADDDDVWATGNGVLCSAQPGSAGNGAGWLLGSALVAFAAARRRRG